MKKTKKSIVLSFSAVLILCSASETSAQCVGYNNKAFDLTRDTWNFRNFGTDLLPWEIYRDTFLGITEEWDPVSQPLDVLFYETVYKYKLTPPGNCYGMSLLSLLLFKKGGHLGFCAPAIQYSGDLITDTGPTDLRLYKAINRMHGHQVNLPSLRFYMDIITKGLNRDGMYAYQQVKYYQARNDPTLVSITNTLAPSEGGHTLVAYDTDDLSGGKKAIYVYDPNFPLAGDNLPFGTTEKNRDWYDADKNYITIDPSDHSWEYDRGKKKGIWSGSPSTGGNIVIIPISIAGPTARSPSSLGETIISEFRTHFFLTGDDAELEQISSAEGKRLFKSGTIEIDTNTETGMLNIVPWYPSGQAEDISGNSQADEPYNWSCYFMLGDPGGALDVEIGSGIGGYEMTVAGQRSYLSVKANRLERESDLVTIENPGTDAPSVKLHNTIGEESYNVEFTQIFRPGEEARVFKLSDVTVPGEEPVELRIVRDQSALEVRSAAALPDYNLQLVRRTQEGDTMTALTEVTFEGPPGTFEMISPTDWGALDVGELQIDLQSIPLEPGWR